MLTSRVEDVNGSAQRFLYVQTRWIWTMYDRTRTFKGILAKCAISRFRIPLLWPLAHRNSQGKVTMTLWEPDYLEPTKSFSRDSYASQSWEERCRLFGSEALEADIRSIARWRGKDPSSIYEHFETMRCNCRDHIFFCFTQNTPIFKQYISIIKATPSDRLGESRARLPSSAMMLNLNS